MRGDSVPFAAWNEEVQWSFSRQGLGDEKGTGRRLCSDDLRPGDIHQTGLSCPLLDAFLAREITVLISLSHG